MRGEGEGCLFFVADSGYRFAVNECNSYDIYIYKYIYILLQFMSFCKREKLAKYSNAL